MRGVGFRVRMAVAAEFERRRSLLAGVWLADSGSGAFGSEPSPRCRTALTLPCPNPSAFLMAKIELNDHVSRVSGKIDGWVYRNLNGRVVAHAYHPPEKDEPSAAQLDHRERFRAAQAYAAEILAHPLRRAVYLKLGAERKRPINALLVSNFLTPPEIETIELADYTGRAGQRIEVLATDLVAVAGVTVEIRTKDGTVIESGPATDEHGVWTYRTTKNVPAKSDWEVEVTARNRADTAAKQTASK